MSRRIQSTDDTSDSASNCPLYIDSGLQEALMQGETSIGFREYAQGVGASIDELYACAFIDSDQRLSMKVELLNAMVWLSQKLNELERK